MAQHQNTWPVAVLCEVFDVSPSGFYRYLQRRAASTLDRDEVTLIAHMQAIAHQTRYSDGSRRMAKQLQDDGFTVGR
jgi:hypothetical protein